jgi:hypothetical protein
MVTRFITCNLLLELHCIYIHVGHIVHMGHSVHYLQSSPHIALHLYSGGSHGAHGTLGSLVTSQFQAIPVRAILGYTPMIGSHELAS